MKLTPLKFSRLSKSLGLLTLVVLGLLSPLHASALSRSNPQNVLFLLYDAGETYAMLPVMKELEKQHNNVKAFAFGNGSTTALKGTSYALDIRSECGIKDFTPGDQITRNQDSTLDIDLLLNCYKPQAVVLGTVSNIQRQLAKIYLQKGIPTFGYYDSFMMIEENPFVFSFKNVLTKTLVAATSIRDIFIKNNFSAENTVTVGQPALENWIHQAQIYNARALREKLNLTETQKAVLFIGGYGKDYSDIVTNFVKSCKSLPTSECLISIHPSQTGELEKSIIKKEQVTNIQITNDKMSTLEAVIAADIIVSHGSTVGIQARFICKESIFFNLEKHSFDDTNIAVKNKWSTQVYSQEELVKALQEKIKLTKNTCVRFENQDIVPAHAAEKIAQLITERRLKEL